MDEYPRLQINVRDTITQTKLQKKLLAVIGNTSVQRGVNRIIADRANQYVPMESGALRASVRVGPKNITWGTGLNYAHYQYEGVVYEDNNPIWSNGRIIGWRSPAGVTKTPTDRELGVPGEWKGWTFGYHTPGTKHHWIDEMWSNDHRSVQQQITRYLKAEAKKRNK